LPKIQYWRVDPESGETYLADEEQFEVDPLHVDYYVGVGSSTDGKGVIWNPEPVKQYTLEPDDYFMTPEEAKEKLDELSKKGWFKDKPENLEELDEWLGKEGGPSQYEDFEGNVYDLEAIRQETQRKAHRVRCGRKKKGTQLEFDFVEEERL